MPPPRRIERIAPTMLKAIDVALLPAEVAALDSHVYVVIDLLRATTTIATLFEHGLTQLTAVADLVEARRLAAAEQALLLGEVGGLPPDGFDLGNSPVEASALTLTGRSAVMFTTNGTAALCNVAGRGRVVAGSLANLSAVCARLSTYESATLVCAGGAAGARFGLDDFGAAALFVHRLRRLAPEARLGDGARLALECADPASLIVRSEHAATLRRLNLGIDIEFALRLDTSRAVPEIIAHAPGRAVLINRHPEARPS